MAGRYSAVGTVREGAVPVTGDVFMRHMRKILTEEGFTGEALENKIQELMQKDVSRLTADMRYAIAVRNIVPYPLFGLGDYSPDECAVALLAGYPAATRSGRRSVWYERGVRNAPERPTLFSALFDLA
jgi:hypothetical protein